MTYTVTAGVTLVAAVAGVLAATISAALWRRDRNREKGVLRSLYQHTEEIDRASSDQERIVKAFHAKATNQIPSWSIANIDLQSCFYGSQYRIRKERSIRYHITAELKARIIDCHNKLAEINDLMDKAKSALIANNTLISQDIMKELATNTHYGDLRRFNEKIRSELREILKPVKRPAWY